jgi:hypothetical protein
VIAGLYLEPIQVESSIAWILKMELTLWVVCVQEAYGKFLDMHELYNRFLNSKFGHPIEYSAFLEEFYQTHQIARHHKLTKQYQEYLTEVTEYLLSFFERTQPLQDINKIFSKVLFWDCSYQYKLATHAHAKEALIR